ncbi:MAG: hypothetical protein IJ186_00115 [Bacilli bacterium]|nr:hypothetical protein [Bacilli bacterium]
MDSKFIKRIGRTNLISSIIFLALALVTLSIALWFLLELSTGHLWGMDKSSEGEGGEGLGKALGIVFMVILLAAADVGFAILGLVFVIAGVPLLINSITLLRIEKIGDLSIITKRLRRSRVVFVISIVIGSIFLIASFALFVSVFTGSTEMNLIFAPILLLAMGLFLIIFSSIEFKRVGKVIIELAGQSAL